MELRKILNEMSGSFYWNCSGCKYNNQCKDFTPDECIALNNAEAEILKHYISKEEVMKVIDDSKISIPFAETAHSYEKRNIRCMQNGADMQFENIRKNLKKAGGVK